MALVLAANGLALGGTAYFLGVRLARKPNAGQAADCFQTAVADAGGAGLDLSTLDEVERELATRLDGVVVDEKNRMVSTPAYMLAGNIGEVFDGALGFAEKLLSLA